MFVPAYGLGTLLNFIAQETGEARRKNPPNDISEWQLFSIRVAGSSSYFKMSDNSLHFEEGTCYFLVVNKTVQGTKFKIQHLQKAIIRTTQLQ